MSPNNENIDTSSQNASSDGTGQLLGEILSSGLQENTPTIDLLSDSFIPEGDILETENNQNHSVGIPEQKLEAMTNEAIQQPDIISEPVKKPIKKSMSVGTFLRLVGAILLVALIFFGAFLAYIVFNPGQATFFISFGINPSDIARLLRQLVSGIFGVVTFMLSVVWIVYLFRAILTKKEYKKKKTISIIFALFFGVLLFSEITLWASLVSKINATDYENPNGGVIVYDNEKFISERFKNQSQMNNFDNLIGPIELKFDLKADANFVAKSMDIESYKIDFDGAKCQGSESSLVEGVNPQNAPSIVCIFDTAKTYRPSGVYTGFDRITKKTVTKSIIITPVSVIGILSIKLPTTSGDHSITYNASSIAHLGNIAWYTDKGGDTPVSTDKIYSIMLDKTEQVLCLGVSEKGKCDKTFIVPPESKLSASANMVVEQDKTFPLRYTFSLDNVKISNGEITGYKWTIDHNTVISTKDTFEYTFPDYASFVISLDILDSGGRTTNIEKTIYVNRPLQFVKGANTESFLKVMDSNGKSLLGGTYNKDLKAYYIISDVSVPAKLSFDATDVAVQNYGYVLQDVEWDFEGDKKMGKKVQYEIVEEKRHTLNIRYSFFSKDKNSTEVLEEKIIIESTKGDLSNILKLTQTSEYAPTVIHVDASASSAKQGTITKFVYDFGEGKGPIEGDAIQDYRYNFPGEYTITLTVVRDDGVKEKASRKIILKDTPRSVVINSSISSGTVGRPIDFDTNGTIGQIEAYQWDFGDGKTSQETNPTHVYQKAGKYTVKITITYADRTVRSTDKEIVVNE